MKLIRSEEGGSVIITALLMVVMLGMAGLAIDMGLMYKPRAA